MATIDKVALALSDPIRLQILDMLVAGRTDCCSSPAHPESPADICSCDLLPVLNLAPSRLSYHMNQLKEAGLVVEQKRGKWVYFAINEQSLAEFQRSLLARFSTFISEPTTDRTGMHPGTCECDKPSCAGTPQG